MRDFTTDVIKTLYNVEQPFERDLWPLLWYPSDTAGDKRLIKLRALARPEKGLSVLRGLT